MNIKTLYINDLQVKTLYINGKQVKIGGSEPELDCLCFTANTPGSTVKMVKHEGGVNVNLQYSTNGKNWSPFVVGTTTVTLTNIGDKVWIKANGSNQKMAYDDETYNGFVMTGSIAASGNVNSLLEEDEETARTMSLEGKCFCRLFYGCSSLTTAPELPSTTIGGTTYYYMFSRTSLTEAPELPATNVGYRSYMSMFSQCTSLTTPPQLSATTLDQDCYRSMFVGCSSLKISDTPVSGGVKFMDIPSDATVGNFWNEKMFLNTGGTYTSDPQVGHAYYYYT